MVDDTPNNYNKNNKDHANKYINNFQSLKYCENYQNVTQRQKVLNIVGGVIAKTGWQRGDTWNPFDPSQTPSNPNTVSPMDS